MFEYIGGLFSLLASWNFWMALSLISAIVCILAVSYNIYLELTQQKRISVASVVALLISIIPILNIALATVAIGGLIIGLFPDGIEDKLDELDDKSIYRSKSSRESVNNTQVK